MKKCKLYRSYEDYTLEERKIYNYIFNGDCGSRESLLLQAYKNMGIKNSDAAMLTAYALMDDGIEDDGHPMPL